MAASSILSLNVLLADPGVYPYRSSGGLVPSFTIGMLQTMAPTVPGFGSPQAQGQSLQLAQHTVLFSIIGTAFGGDGRTDFSLPNLTNRSSVGGQGTGNSTPDALAVTWLIAPGNLGGTPPPGALIPFAGGYCPDGWLVADGTSLPVSSGTELFFVIGTLFGGDGTNDFALPDMTGMTAYGAGEVGGTTLDVGAKVGGTVPGIALNYLISLDGIFPSTGDGFGSNDALLGQVIAYGGLDAPKGWAFCDGSLLPIATNKPLYTLIGTQFGGDGVTDFALPDLRGRRVVGH